MNVNMQTPKFGSYSVQRGQNNNSNESLKNTSNDQKGSAIVKSFDEAIANNPSLVDDISKQLEKLIKEKAMIEGFTVTSNGIVFDSADEENPNVNGPNYAPKKGGGKKTLVQCINDAVKKRSDMHKEYVQNNRDAAGPFFAGVIDGIINYFRQ